MNRRKRIFIFNGTKININKGYIAFERVLKKDDKGFIRDFCRIVVYIKHEFQMHNTPSHFVSNIVQATNRTCELWLHHEYNLLTTINLSINV